jgi:hypothetical protein
MKKTPIPSLSSWRAAEWFGAFFVIAAFAFFAVTLWLGWPAVSGWVWSH